MKYIFYFLIRVIRESIAIFTCLSLKRDVIDMLLTGLSGTSPFLSMIATLSS